MTVVESDRHARAAELLRRKQQRAQPIALSAAQHRLWLLAQLEPDAPTYNVPYAFRLRGSLDRDALERALNTIVRRHDVLRATIVMYDTEPAYAIDENFRLALPFVELAAATLLEPLLAAESGRVFDLRTAPPIRALLVQIAPADHALLVTLHHIATDGWSMAIFKRELCAVYDAFRAYDASPLPDVRCTYADYAQWQRAAHADGELADATRYWIERLRDVPPPLEVVPRPGLASTSTAADGCTPGHSVAKRLPRYDISAGRDRASSPCSWALSQSCCIG